MRQVVAVEANIILFNDEKDEHWHPAAEIIIVTNEPRRHLDEDLHLKVSRRECEQFRFMANEEQITNLIQGLEKIRFDIQSQTTAADSANIERKKVA